MSVEMVGGSGSVTRGRFGSGAIGNHGALLGRTGVNCRAEANGGERDLLRLHGGVVGAAKPAQAQECINDGVCVGGVTGALAGSTRGPTLGHGISN